jgi:aspartate/methionine/tyrosine aminotransferase
MDGVPRTIPVGPEFCYQLAAQHINAHWNERSVAALVATPSNPTGTVIAPEELARIHRAVRSRNGTLIVDEIYQGLTYGIEPSTALSLSDDVFVVNSFSKYFQMTGWRLGWLVVPPAYVRDVEKLAQNLFISPSAPAQHAALAAFHDETIAIVEARRREFEQRRDFLIPGLRSLGFEVPVVPQGAFYVYADSSRIATDSFKLAGRILQESHVALTPGRDFGTAAPERHIRIAYTQEIARIGEALDRMKRVIQP